MAAYVKAWKVIVALVIVVVRLGYVFPTEGGDDGEGDEEKYIVVNYDEADSEPVFVQSLIVKPTTQLERRGNRIYANNPSGQDVGHTDFLRPALSAENAEREEVRTWSGRYIGGNITPPVLKCYEEGIGWKVAIKNRHLSVETSRMISTHNERLKAIFYSLEQISEKFLYGRWRDKDGYLRKYVKTNKEMCEWAREDEGFSEEKMRRCPWVLSDWAKDWIHTNTAFQRSHPRTSTFSHSSTKEGNSHASSTTFATSSITFTGPSPLYTGTLSKFVFRTLIAHLRDYFSAALASAYCAQYLTSIDFLHVLIITDSLPMQNK